MRCHRPASFDIHRPPKPHTDGPDPVLCENRRNHLFELSQDAGAPLTANNGCAHQMLQPPVSIAHSRLEFRSADFHSEEHSGHFSFSDRFHR